MRERTMRELAMMQGYGMGISQADEITRLWTEIERLQAEIDRLRDDRDLEKRWRKDADDYREEIIEKNERLKSLLTGWQEFGKDVRAADLAGQDWLDGLRGRTKAALEQKP